MSVSHQNLISVLQHKVETTPKASLYTFLDRNGQCVDTLTVAELYQQAVQLAVLLQREKLVKQPLLLCYPHGPGFIIAFFGALLAGAWPVPVAWSRSTPWSALLQILSSCDAHAILTTSERQHAITGSFPAVSDLRIIATDKEVPEGLGLAVQQQWQCPAANGRDLAFIQYTSGSTSQPKGVMITHRNILDNSACIQQAFNSGPEDVGVCWLPFHHDMGLIGHVVQPLYAGVHNYFLKPLDFIADPIHWLRAISRYGGTISGGPDFAYAHCAASSARAGDNELDLRRWRIAYIGSERILPRTLCAFATSFRQSGFDGSAFFPCYGLAESTLFVSGRQGVPGLMDKDNSDSLFRGVSLGKTARYSVVIVDPDTETPMTDGVSGEIYVRSGSVSPGYYMNRNNTRRSFNRAVSGICGYHRTGDIGCIKEGQLYFHGRLKNLVKRRGKSFFCEDIEAVVEQNLLCKGLRRCVAFSLNSDSGELLILLLEMNVDDCASSDALLVTEVNAMVLDNCGMLPNEIRLVPRNSLPLTSSGKLRRVACNTLYRKIKANESEVCDD